MFEGLIARTLDDEGSSVVFQERSKGAEPGAHLSLATRSPSDCDSSGPAVTFAPLMNGSFSKGFHPDGSVRASRTTAPGYLGAGMPNAANSCFLNATVQALVHCPLILEDAIDENHKSRCIRLQKNQPCGLCDFERHVRKMTVLRTAQSPRVGHRGKDVTPVVRIDFLKQLTRDVLAKRHLEIEDQNCAHEFFVIFLEWLRSQELPLELQEDFERNELPQSVLTSSYFHQAFFSNISIRKTCLNCHTAENKSEDINEFNVIPGECSIAESMRKSFATEILEGRNKITCDVCKSKQSFVWEKRVHKISPIIVVSATRVQWDAGRGRPVKNLKNLFDPNSVKSVKDLRLNLNDMLRFSEKVERGPLKFSVKARDANRSPFSTVDNIYEPYSAIVHRGGANSGHYFTLVNKSLGNGKNQWTMYNDEQVCAFTESEAMGFLAKASLIFYRRESPQPVLITGSDIPVDEASDSQKKIVLQTILATARTHDRSPSSASTATGGGSTSVASEDPMSPSPENTIATATLDLRAKCSSCPTLVLLDGLVPESLDPSSTLEGLTIEDSDGSNSRRLTRHAGRFWRTTRKNLAALKYHLQDALSSDNTDKVIASRLSPCKRLESLDSYPLLDLKAAQNSHFASTYTARCEDDREFDRGRVKKMNTNSDSTEEKSARPSFLAQLECFGGGRSTYKSTSNSPKKSFTPSPPIC